ncbi:hypothetical protein C5167_006363 [Papaver somniferum]|uniref:Response regulatory domain-containing protein n=1 Tax=Papaver somniferum TaxID=3469 RepID=A0A4Y7JGK0_PAPSO|nr:two-component response regulator ARR5-like [Papaver somniferum]RZC59061.1 hypothetical protein C5167_006363 [Papaver somniferum]
MTSVDMLSMHTDKLQSFKRFEHHQEEELHVLAVDDSNIDRKVIERLLKISSCKVTAVDSGKRALQLLGLDVDYNKTCSSSGALKVNMIITDYWMPGMTGYELLKKIKESSLFKEIPVVIMSSENVLPRINRCLEEGAEDFLVKPVQLSDVKRLKNHIIRDDYLHQQHQIMADIKDSAISNKRKLNDSSSDLIDIVPSSPVSTISSPVSTISSPSSTLSSPTSTISSISMASSTKSSMIESPSRRFRPTTDEILSLI